MTQPLDDPEWDDIVDVICVGSTPGVLGYLSACEANGLDVEHVAAPADFDSETRAYLAAMTEGLDPRPDDTEPARTDAVPDPLPRDRRGRPEVLEAFVGERLRRWSARCLASPFAVVLTAVPDIFSRMSTDTGEVIVAVDVGPAAVSGTASPDSPNGTFAGLLYQDGRLAGALVQADGSARRVRADGGLALPIGPSATHWPSAHGSLSLVSRPAGRFARLEVLRVRPEADPQ